MAVITIAVIGSTISIKRLIVQYDNIMPTICRSAKHVTLISFIASIVTKEF
jgi:hypothetical protein